MYSHCVIVLFMTYVVYCVSFTNKSHQRRRASASSLALKDSKKEEILLELLTAEKNKGRGKFIDSNTLDSIISTIDDLERVKSNTNAINDVNIDGVWQLLYTSSPGTNSPIQRTFTSIDSISIYQVVNLINQSKSFLDDSKPDVSNIVCFGDRCRLRVTALASTYVSELIEPRKNDGKILGLNIFGISSSSKPRSIDERIDFAFQEALFEFNGFKLNLPYPVPFKLLGDEAKGWLDTTYLSKNIRISRGNKGTIFVLKKVDETIDYLASVASIDAKELNAGYNRMQFNNKIDGTTTANKLNINNKSTSTRSDVMQSFNWMNIFNNSNSGKATASTAASKRKKKQVGIILPAQLGSEDDYDDLITLLKRKKEIDCTVIPIKRSDWILGLLPSFFSKEYVTGTLLPSRTLSFYFDKIDIAIEAALADNEDAEITLISHSIGGWIGRAYVSEWVSNTTKSKIKKLVTLGSPHKQIGKIDQTRGLLSYVTRNYPDNHVKSIDYYSISSNAVTGSLSLFNIQSLLAYISYTTLSGDSISADGDGIVPVSISTLDGATNIVIADAYHSDYIPNPVGASLKMQNEWYGSERLIDQWINVLD